MEHRSSEATAARMTPALIDEPKSKTGRFITLSMFVHAAMVATVALMSFPKSQVGKPEVIEIEMADESPISSMTLPDGTADAGSGAPATPPQEAMVSREDITPAPAPAVEPAPRAVVAPTAPAQTQPKVKSLPPPPALRAAVEAPRTPQPTAAPEATSTAAPQSSQPSASQLETADDGDVAVAPATTKVIEDETEKIDQDREQALAAEAEARDAKAAKEAAALAEEKAREEAKAAEAAAIANEARRAQEAQAAAEAQAEAQAAAQAEKQARLQAAREARAKERADAEARARSKSEADQGAGTTSGTGAGDSASPEPTKQVAGIPGGVRTLGQLRQKPGNKSPQYDAKERLARQEGDVVFYAYVNTDGSLSDFKMAQSTGFTNLDDKTLAALKKWKFYPGQEGWVEMPFKWSLRGEAQQAGGLLR
jgi:TonB family protein